MFGIHYVKFEPTDYVMVYSKGVLKRQGKGLSFYYYSPITSIVKVPLSSQDASFIFNEISSDFQTLSIQGQVTYRIANQKKVAETLNFTLDKYCNKYSSEDPLKLSDKVINGVKVVTRRVIEDYELKEAISNSDVITKRIMEEVKNHPIIETLGIEIDSLSILSLAPTKETARALEASAREEIMKKADEAIYERRNASIKQERIVKENEYNTQIAMELKKKEVLEKELQAKRFSQEKENELLEDQMAFDTHLEEQKQNLIDLSIVNRKAEADAEAYAMSAVFKTLEQIDERTLAILSKMDMKPEKLIALAFGDLANNAQKIGQLSITPDLLEGIMKG